MLFLKKLDPLYKRVASVIQNLVTNFYIILFNLFLKIHTQDDNHRRTRKRAGNCTLYVCSGVTGSRIQYCQVPLQRKEGSTTKILQIASYVAKQLRLMLIIINLKTTKEHVYFTEYTHNERKLKSSKGQILINCAYFIKLLVPDDYIRVKH